jgi:hypothetical protein
MVLPVCTAAGSALHADTPEKHLDVPQWFDACTALSSAPVADIMDSNCMANAYDYCEVGRPVAERRPCMEDLTGHLRKRTDEIAELLPDQVPGLSAFREHGYKRQLKEFRAKGSEPDCTQLTEFQCKALGVVARWSTARQLARTSGILEGMDTK